MGCLGIWGRRVGVKGGLFVQACSRYGWQGVWKEQVGGRVGSGTDRDVVDCGNCRAVWCVQGVGVSRVRGLRSWGGCCRRRREGYVLSGIWAIITSLSGVRGTARGRGGSGS